MDPNLRPFDLHPPTRVVFGAGALRQAGTVARWYGRRVLVVMGARSARNSGAAVELADSLAAAGARVEYFEGVGSNPTVASVDAGVALAKARLAEVVIGLGGGSVIDTAKAIATAAWMNRPGDPDRLGSYRLLLSGLRPDGVRITGALPTIAIPTLLGSGSETNGTSVIIDEATGRKLSAHSERSAPRVALIDPAWAGGAPRRLLAAGCADALAHALEAALSATTTVAARTSASAAARELLDAGPAACDGDAVALARCHWASQLAGAALSGAGSIATHPLSHPLSARSAAHHGEAVAALQPAVLASLGERFEDGIAYVASWFGTRAKTTDGRVRAIISRLDEWHDALGVTLTADTLGLDPARYGGYAGDVIASGSRGLANTPGDPLAEADLVRIYERAAARL